MKRRTRYDVARALVLARMAEGRAALIADIRRVRPVRGTGHIGQWVIERKLSTFLSSMDAKLMLYALVGAFVLRRRQGLAGVFRSRFIAWAVKGIRAIVPG